MTTEEFKKILDKGETDTVEFKSWAGMVVHDCNPSYSGG